MTRRRALAILIAMTSTGIAHAQSLTPLVVDWEQVFRLEWSVSDRDGRTLIFGKIHNVSFYGTSRIQLLIDQLDSGGRTVGQRIAWLGYNLKAGDSGFFDVTVPDRAATYRVRVYAFDRKFGSTQS